MMEERSKTLLDTLPVAIARHNGDGVITFVNAAFERETGLAAATLPGRPVRDLRSFDAAGTQAWAEALQAVLRKGSAAPAEVRCGEAPATRHFAVELVPETSPDGRPGPAPCRCSGTAPTCVSCRPTCNNPGCSCSSSRPNW
jgi:PAS domain-containing protein